MLMGVVLVLSVLAAIGSGASSAGADEACPNETIRIAQHATQTGDCRAWERVSPADKGGDIVAQVQSVVAAEDGGGAVFHSLNGFGDTVGSGGDGFTVYLARREAEGWSVHSVTPQGRPEIAQVGLGPTWVMPFSSDLSHALVTGYDLPGAVGSTPERRNKYLEDTATRSLTTITRSQRGNGEDPIQYRFFEFGCAGLCMWGASDDLSHVAWPTSTQMLPAGTAPGYPQGTEFAPSLFSDPNVYTWDEGVLHLASVLPDGSAAPEGAKVEPEQVRGTMSADGSRQTFEAPPTGNSQLYLRIDHSRTALVSESENGAFTEEAQEVFFNGMSPDGRNVFFTSISPLLAADDAPGPDLYRWTDSLDPEHEDNLTLITNNGGAVSDFTGTGSPLIGMSDAATRVYVHSAGGRIELWEEGNGIKTIDPDVPRPITRASWLSLLGTLPGRGRVSPDGNWIAYITRDNEMRLYDRQRDTVTKVAASVSLTPELTKNGNPEIVGLRPRFLSSGAKVFFTSVEALLPEDTNGVADVYQYDGPSGKLSLVTSGGGGEPMEFADASADGSEVFFYTRDQLVPSDTDEFIDLYVARVDGGFDEPEPSPVVPCNGEACQGAGSVPITVPELSSRAPMSGNVKPGRHCGHGRRPVRRHGKVRCAKRHSAHHRGKHHRRSYP